MADNDKKSGAQHELGNLFVDIGSSGLGGLLKGLNSLSATFLLSKNAAEQFAKPIVDLSKNAGKGIVGLEKINAVTGLTLNQLQNLEMWAKQNSVDFGSFISQVGNLQQNLLDIAMGKGGNMKGFTLLGIDPRSLDYKKPLEALDTIKKRVLQLDEATGALALRELGLSSDLLYAWRNERNRINEKLLLNGKEAANLKEQNVLWNTLGVTINAILTKWIAQQTWINTILNKSIDYLNSQPDIIREITALVKEMLKWVLFVGKGWKAILEAMIIVKNANTNPIKQEQIDNMTPEQRKKYEAARKKQQEERIKAQHGANITDKELEAKTTVEDIKQARKDAKRFHLLPMLYRFVKKHVDANAEDFSNSLKSNNLNQNEVLSAIPPSLKNGNNSDSAYDLGAINPVAVNSNNVTNNITLNQDISGQDAPNIASRTAEKTIDTLESLERQLQYGF